MKNKIYLCCYSTGDYEDYRIINVFATTNKSKAKKWVSKFNRILNKWSYYYSQFEENKYGFRHVKDEYAEKYYVRWYSLYNTNNAFIQEVELR